MQIIQNNKKWKWRLPEKLSLSELEGVHQFVLLHQASVEWSRIVVAHSTRYPLPAVNILTHPYFAIDLWSRGIYGITMNTLLLFMDISRVYYGSLRVFMVIYDPMIPMIEFWRHHGILWRYNGILRRYHGLLVSYKFTWNALQKFLIAWGRIKNAVCPYTIITVTLTVTASQTVTVTASQTVTVTASQTVTVTASQTMTVTVTRAGQPPLLLCQIQMDWE